MCGIVGALAFSDTTDDMLVSPIRRLSHLMARRGPDDEGEWTDHRRYAVGFRRLSILDLGTTGHQPMVSSEGRFVLAFNGEIYNFRELRAELEHYGVYPVSSGDAEVLLLALRQWGTGAISRLNGMFAFALYDSRERSLLLARDHAGIKPLFLGRSSRGLVFASQYNQLLAHPWLADARPEPASIGLYLRLGFMPTSHGLHVGTGQVRAGEWMTVTAKGDARTGRHFELPPWRPSRLRARDASDALDAALVAAVKRQMVADVPVGVLLSGGVDSPLVAAEARRTHGGAMHAFTIGVDDVSLDESEDAARYATELGLEHRIEKISHERALSLLDDVVSACTEPMADFSIFPTLLVSELAHRSVKVVLSGDGGDELYWGYPSRFGAAIALAPYFRWPTVARLAAVIARRLSGRGRATRDVLRYGSVGRLYLRKHTLIPESDLSALFPTLPPVPSSFREFDCTSSDPDEVAQWVRWNEFVVHLDRVLAKVDRASMHHSLEVRVPLLDKEVIDVAWWTDWRACLNLAEKRGKMPLRDVLGRRVRYETRAKRGFTVPMHRWLTGPLNTRLRALLFHRDEILGLPVRARALADMEARLQRGDRSKAWGLWLLMSLVLWEQAHGRSMT